MRCQQVVIELDAYLTGELEPPADAQVESHLKECAACAAELEVLRKEPSFYQAYASTIQSPADAWSNIQARMASRNGGVFFRGRFLRLRTWAVAASVLLAVALSLVIYYKSGSSQFDSPETSERAAEIQFHIDRAVNDFEQALTLLNQSYAAKKRQLDPQLAAELERNLRVIDVAIAQCQRALQENPNSRQAAEFLLIAYQKKIDILEHITEEK
jgi:anti-sigma factor RsiW